MNVYSKGFLTLNFQVIYLKFWCAQQILAPTETKNRPLLNFIHVLKTTKTGTGWSEIVLRKVMWYLVSTSKSQSSLQRCICWLTTSFKHKFVSKVSISKDWMTFGNLRANCCHLIGRAQIHPTVHVTMAEFGFIKICGVELSISGAVLKPAV